ncbi:methionine ABC transporter permease [Brassicibacter mesophilus]|uniref:methionine ABC transporter permease n=1 Tax=Brassicibacter mesophilus TaxID=745119 RepID=UPI003D1DFFBD
MNGTFLDQCIFYGKKLVFPSIFVTLRMVAGTMIIGSICGFILAILLTMYGPNGLKHKKSLYQVMSFLINTIRSFPILILIVAISPLTRLIIGTTIGEKAVILPLSIAATAFIARLLESNFIKVDKQLIEAARSFGATNMQIMFRVIIKESIPSIISVITIATVTYIAATTIAGAVGGGGLGAVSLTYGYQSFNNIVLYMAVLVLFIMVNLVQFIGDWLYKKFQ